jgi:hypothetical protein
VTETLHTTCTVELEIGLTGQYHPYVPVTAPSYASGGDPAEEAHVDDIDVTAVVFERRVDKRRWKTRISAEGASLTSLLGDFEVTRFDILAGLDAKARGIVIANLLEAMGRDAELSLMDEAS